MVHFDVIASSDTIASSALSGWWQDICIKVPLTPERKSPISDGNGANLKDFCEIFERDDHCRISLKLQDGALFRTPADALKHRASPGTGMPLAHVLDEYELSVKQKLSLAHSVALAFWQYYDSQLMHRAWTSHSIWFMPEPDLEDNSERLPLRTYITFHPEATECAYDASEFIMTHSLIHRCPRIQYLALLLLEIGLGRPFRGRFFDRQVSQLNYYNSIASKYLEELKSTTWESFDHKYILTDAIEECLKFDALTGRDGNLDKSERHIFRRSKIYDKVVSPLGWLNSSFQRATAQIDYLTAKRHALVPELDESRFTNTTQRALPTNNEAKNSKTIEASGMRPIDQDGFETAIICALTLEADAIDALFDYHWEPNVSYSKTSNDPNAYSTGVIGRHNVVLVHMSGMGKSAAAKAAMACLASFPKIKLAILVGVCGVVPVIHDTGKPINLGDVIISNGVVQYDFGRQLAERFERKDALLDSLGRPNPEIRSTLNKLQGIRGMREMKRNMIRYLSKLGEDRDLEARHPFPGGNPPKPEIHFGLIASGDTVMKSAKQRDDIAKRENTIAFEMEGAGVWEILPCLVIKGACDYADSRKTKVFQRYAAATAAACTKAFLDSWESSQRVTTDDDDQYGIGLELSSLH
ncbi:hypothetical protein LCI18_000445 [Fusarium solani-melongenae]|uniref:Uncharacterized protein n=1 Tax=Fusarium solani subsp. cucurbitae TaxID=2747967 RepID=A0ACD3YKT9_FUSSC|nr:hypothetical protein LCI18_000445 [Fusarium solani-melongenae]